MQTLNTSTKDKKADIGSVYDVGTYERTEFGTIRTVTIDGEPWLVGKDVAEILGYTNPNEALSDHVDGEDKLNSKTLLSCNLDLGQRGGWLINESGLYALVLSSKMPTAKKFRRWVTSEVLPSIRNHGIYATENVIDNILNNPDFGIQLLEKLKEEKRARAEAERKNAILSHVNKTYTMTEIAKELNMKSANQLNKVLAEMKIQYKVNGTWVFYSDYSNLGYEEIKQEILDSGRVVYHRKITQLGREFILGLFKEQQTA